jgi:hypothetical protein
MTMANEPLADARDMLSGPGFLLQKLEGRPCLRWLAQQCPRHALGVTRQAARERWHEVDGPARDESPGAMEVSSGA